MSNYVKSTDFAVKDGLLTGNPNKIIKGTEIDTEFNAIAVAVQTKADLASPTFTGTPAAPTAAGGTNTTQIATTAFVTAADTAVITAERTATATLTNKTLTSPVINTPTITGGSISGITDLAVTDGGTGASSITANSVILGNGTSALSGNLVAPGASGNVLTSNGTTWTSTTVDKLSTASGSAPSYSARAWVNFNGTTNTGGNCDIRASGNVSTVADNGTGDYTVNFTIALQDANYCMAGSVSTATSTANSNSMKILTTNTPTTTALRIATGGGGVAVDPDYCSVVIFR